MLSLLRLDPVFRGSLALVPGWIILAVFNYFLAPRDWHRSEDLVWWLAVWLLIFVVAWLGIFQRLLRERCGELQLALPLEPRPLWTVRLAAFAFSIALPLGAWLAFYSAAAWPRIDDRVVGLTIRVGVGLFFAVLLAQSRSPATNRVSGGLAAPIYGGAFFFVVGLIFVLRTYVVVLLAASAWIALRSLRAMPAAWALAPPEPRPPSRAHLAVRGGWVPHPLPARPEPMGEGGKADRSPRRPSAPPASREGRIGRIPGRQRWPVHRLLRRVILPSWVLWLYLGAGALLFWWALSGIPRGMLLLTGLVVTQCVMLVFYHSLDGLHRISHLPVSRQRVFAYAALPGVSILAVLTGVGGRQTHETRELCLQAIGIGLIWLGAMLLAMTPIKYGKPRYDLRWPLTSLLGLVFFAHQAAARWLPEHLAALHGGAERLAGWLPASPAMAWALTAAMATGCYLLAERRFERLDGYGVAFTPATRKAWKGAPL